MQNVRVTSLPILLLALLFSTATVHAESTSAKADGKKEVAATKETPAKKETAKKEKAAKKERTAKKELLSRKAKIKFAQAERIALKKVPGKTHEIELEMEDGKLVYSVEIEGTDGTTEVSIDAISGDVLKVEKDDDDDETKKSEGQKSKKDGDEASD